MEVDFDHSVAMGEDPHLTEYIITQVKNQGIFDKFRKESLADVDTKPAYQNLQARVESSVNSFLSKQMWRSDLNKNQIRECLRKHISEAPYLETGIDRIVDQVVNPKVYSIFMPQIEDIVYKILGIQKPVKFKTNETNSIGDLLPKDLDPVSPESDMSSLPGTSDKSLDNNINQMSKFSKNIYESSYDKAKTSKHSRCEKCSGQTGDTCKCSNNDKFNNNNEKMDDVEEESPDFEPINTNFHEFHHDNDSNFSAVSETTKDRSQIYSDSNNDSTHMQIDLDYIEPDVSKHSSDFLFQKFQIAKENSNSSSYLEQTKDLKTEPYCNIENIKSNSSNYHPEEISFSSGSSKFENKNSTVDSKNNNLKDFIDEDKNLDSEDRSAKSGTANEGTKKCQDKRQKDNTREKKSQEVGSRKDSAEVKSYKEKIRELMEKKELTEKVKSHKSSKDNDSKEKRRSHKSSSSSKKSHTSSSLEKHERSKHSFETSGNGSFAKISNERSLSKKRSFHEMEKIKKSKKDESSKSKKLKHEIMTTKVNTNQVREESKFGEFCLPIKKRRFALSDSEVQSISEPKKEKVTSQITELQKPHVTKSQFIDDVASVPDEERVQIIEIFDAECEEPYPDYQCEMSLEETSKIILEGNLDDHHFQNEVNRQEFSQQELSVGKQEKTAEPTSTPLNQELDTEKIEKSQENLCLKQNEHYPEQAMTNEQENIDKIYKIIECNREQQKEDKKLEDENQKTKEILQPQISTELPVINKQPDASEESIITSTNTNVNNSANNESQNELNLFKNKDNAIKIEETEDIKEAQLFTVEEESIHIEKEKIKNENDLNINTDSCSQGASQISDEAVYYEIKENILKISEVQHICISQEILDEFISNIMHYQENKFNNLSILKDYYMKKVTNEHNQTHEDIPLSNKSEIDTEFLSRVFQEWLDSKKAGDFVKKELNDSSPCSQNEEIKSEIDYDVDEYCPVSSPEADCLYLDGDNSKYLEYKEFLDTMTEDIMNTNLEEIIANLGGKVIKSTSPELVLQFESDQSISNNFSVTTEDSSYLQQANDFVKNITEKDSCYPIEEKVSKQVDDSDSQIKNDNAERDTFDEIIKQNDFQENSFDQPIKNKEALEDSCSVPSQVKDFQEENLNLLIKKKGSNENSSYQSIRKKDLEENSFCQSKKKEGAEGGTNPVIKKLKIPKIKKLSIHSMHNNNANEKGSNLSLKSRSQSPQCSYSDKAAGSSTREVKSVHKSSQRYSSDDLYKPRILITRRNRSNNQSS